MTDDINNAQLVPGSMEYIKNLLNEVTSENAKQKENEVKALKYNDNVEKYGESLKKLFNTGSFDVISQKVSEHGKEIKELREHDETSDKVLNGIFEMSQANHESTKTLEEGLDKVNTKVDSMISMAENASKGVSTVNYSSKYKMALPSAIHKEVLSMDNTESYKMFEADKDGDSYESYECPSSAQPFYMYEENDAKKDTDEQFHGKLIFTGCILKSEGCRLQDNGMEFILGEDGVCYATAVA